MQQGKLITGAIASKQKLKEDMGGGRDCARESAVTSEGVWKALSESSKHQQHHDVGRRKLFKNTGQVKEMGREEETKKQTDDGINGLGVEGINWS